MSELEILLYQVVDYFFRVLYFCILIRIIMSWIPSAQNSFVAKIIRTLTDPIINPIRRIISKSAIGGAGMPIDFSPMIAMIGLEFVSRIIKYIISAVL